MVLWSWVNLNILRVISVTLRCVLWRHRYELRKLISSQNRQWKYCDCSNGNKTFDTIWTKRHLETCWRQKDTSVEKATGQRHAVLVGPPIGDDMWNCRGELPKITVYFEKRIKIGNCMGLIFGSCVNFHFCLKGKLHRFTVHFDSLSFFTPTHAFSHTTMY
jgi:hypothetical protein